MNLYPIFDITPMLLHLSELYNVQCETILKVELKPLIKCSKTELFQAHFIHKS